ncbi:hypothetical protein BGZ63DRAFT_399931 [Mariannaea sp. PMI_226]|nr:hypothetical protein BGZ63DRAFT_399931 [Mariannaea sp. PMI_226]
METTCSPSKRRALAPLNANALASPKTLFKDGKTLGGKLGSPVKLATEGRKRLFEVDASASPVGKKTCLGRDEDASSRSDSPDTSSLFDTSANDASWTTTTTEPDAAAPMAAAALAAIRPNPLTRQQAREKVEILRLRLSLANYKVRTGQTNVPLADLQPRPLPRPVPQFRVHSPDAPSGEPEHEPDQTDSQATEDEDDHRQAPSSEPEDNDDDAAESIVPDSPPASGAGTDVANVPPPSDVSEPQATTSTPSVSISPANGSLGVRSTS